MVGISQTYLHYSHLASIDSGSYFSIFPAHFLQILSYFLHISAELEPEKGERGQMLRGSLQFLYSPQGWSAKFFQIPRRPIIDRKFPHLFSRLAPRFGRFRGLYFFILFTLYSYIFSSYFFSIWSREEEERETGFMRGRGLEDFLFTPEVELGMFPSLRVLCLVGIYRTGL